MACDLCNKKSVALYPLLDLYKTEDVQEICNDCETAVNKHLGKVKRVTTNMLSDLIRRYLTERKFKHE